MAGDQVKGIIMERIAKTVAIVALASAATAATAADTPFPSSARDTYSQYEVFPNMETYASRHADSADRQALTAYADTGAARHNVSANERYAQRATRTDAPTWDVSPRIQVESRSPFPSSEAVIDD